jgi:deoxyribodipyrimidine photo-lyase
MKIVIFWFRRDLRLEDNTALYHALKSGQQVMPVFIFDRRILRDFPKDDARVTFFYNKLKDINDRLKIMGSSINVLHGDTLFVWQNLIKEHNISAVYVNKDYEPYARERDRDIFDLLKINSIPLYFYKDQVIFEQDEILKNDGKPYTVFTPYKRKWLELFHPGMAATLTRMNFDNFHKARFNFPSLDDLGLQESNIKVRDYDLSQLDNYAEMRDIPGADATSYLSPHLRFGTLSIRQVIQKLQPQHDVFLSELIWREFFMQILYHFPKVTNTNFNPKYNGVKWRNDREDFERWCNGQTGYPMVDAGMRQLNQTGYMHNRVRMVTASFLTKHLLIHWLWGEDYFARKLLDYELSSNNGNWQWAAGTGCDAAPYFRIFNPTEQLKKFDKNLLYVKRWLPEYGTPDYPQPMIDHKYARQRALDTYQKGIKSKSS